jgi:ADP-ribosylglycohydrolase
LRDRRHAGDHAKLGATGSPLTQLAFAEAYVRVYKLDPRGGYAKGYRSLLETVESGQQLLERLGLAISERSGGAMGAVVCGIYPKLSQVLAVATMQASITHNTPSGINAARAAAAAGHFMLHKLGAKADLGTFLAETLKGDDCNWADPWIGGR